MIDIDLIRQGVQELDPSDTSRRDEVVLAIGIIPIAAIFTLVIVFLFFALLYVAAQPEKPVTDSPARPPRTSPSDLLVFTVALGVFLAILAAYAFAFHLWYAPRHALENDLAHAADTIAESVENTYQVDNVDTGTRGGDDNALGYNFTNMLTAIESDTPGDLPLVTVEVSGSTATYGVSFDNDTGEVELHNTAVFDNYPDPDALLRDNQE